MTTAHDDQTATVCRDWPPGPMIGLSHGLSDAIAVKIAAKLRDQAPPAIGLLTLAG